jgi:hypothetical protein
LSCAAVLAEWDKFIAGENLQDIMEMVNKTTVDHKKYYFINFCKRKKLQHHHSDQFNGTMPQPSKKKSLDLSPQQCKFHMSLSNILIAL